MWKPIVFIIFQLSLSMIMSCDNHRYQSSFRPYEADPLDRKKSVARIPPEGTLPQGNEQWESDMGYPEGVVVDKNFLKSGQRLFELYCIVCHDREGKGEGIVTKKGFSSPPSYMEDRLLEAGPEYFYQIMTYGGDRMPSYRRRLSSLERWKIVSYIKSLQLSRKFKFKDLDQTEKNNFL